MTMMRDFFVENYEDCTFYDEIILKQQQKLNIKDQF